ncbi:MAG: FAD-binding oxidoreductase [Alphaproteobacteria bacterium]
MSATIAGHAPQRSEADNQRVLAVLKQRFGDRFTDSTAIREQHGNQTSWLPNQPPDAVVFPHTTEEVAEIVRICADGSVPIIAFGVGSSLEGHINAPFGGVSIDFAQMKQIVAVHAEDLDCSVQAGVTRRQLDAHLRDMGLFFPIDPGADATFGGMAATRASGTNAVRYGTMRDNIISLTAVMADGTIIKTGQRAKKSSAGYDLTRLMIGSEGTLGIITELVLKLHGIPEAMAGGVVHFDTVEAACETTMMAIQSGIPVARIELLDGLMVQACNAHSKLDLAEKPTLFVEFHGSHTGVREQSELFGEICQHYGGGEFQWSASPEERNRLWRARHDVYWATRELRPGADATSTDVCVPISRLAEIVSLTKEDIDRSGLVAPIVGHVGDGNFHVALLVDGEDRAELAAARAFIDRLSRRAIEMDGTCTGEHGVGQGKVPYLRAEHGPALDVMKSIKTTFDPQGIMNPGKIFASG